MSILVVQHISTNWSKASRGGPNARLRNAAPVALPLSQLPAAGARSLLHEVHFNERDEFTPREEFVFNNNVMPQGRALCITAGRSTDQAWASYDYSRECGGAPDRSGTRKTLFAPVNRWVRISANGRFASVSYGDWYYEKHVVNVGLFVNPHPDCFTASEPDAVFDALAMLS